MKTLLLNFFLAAALLMLSGCGDDDDTINGPGNGPEDTSLVFRVSLDRLDLRIGEQGALTIEVERLPATVTGLSVRLMFDSHIVGIYDSFEVGDVFGDEAISFFEVESSVVHLAVSAIEAMDAPLSAGIVGTMTVRGLRTGECEFLFDESQVRLIDAAGTDVLSADMEFEGLAVSVR